MIKKSHLTPILLLLLSTLTVKTPSVFAKTESQIEGELGISFKGLEDPKYGVLDPEKEGIELQIDEDYGKTMGSLRIDFVPNINFSQNKVTEGNSNYKANGLLFKNVIAPRGQFIQVSDYREQQTGWSLQVRQETQFTNQNNKNVKLAGAVLSFDKSWVNTLNGAGINPSVSKEVIRLNNIGETYTLAHAKTGTGGGTWSVIFGASPNNQNNEASTLSPRLDGNGQVIIDPSRDNQAIYMNNAVQLSIPGGTKKEPGTYSTVLTWIISELP